MAKQAATYRCECGHDATVERLGPFEFHVWCARCRRVYVLTWPTDGPAPTFEGDEPPPRMPLRSAVHAVGCLCEECSAAYARAETYDPRDYPRVE